MILVDTSVWVDHFRATDPILVDLLEAGSVLTHPFVIGELALGNLRRRDAVLTALADLPSATRASDAEVLTFINAQGLQGLGVGYVDAHLLASVRLTPGARLLSRDQRLMAAGDRLGLSATGPI